MAAVPLRARDEGGRLIRWSVLPLLSYVAYLAWRPGDLDHVDLVNDIVQTVVPLAVVVPLTARAALRSSGRARTAWWLLTAACASWGLGQLAWTWTEEVLHVSPYPSLADVGFLAAVPLLLAGVLCYPAAELLALGRLRAVLDGGLVAASLLFVCFGTVLSDAEPGSGQPLASWLLAVVYPVSDVIAASIVVAVLTRRSDRWSGPLPLIAAGVVAIAVADTAFAMTTATSSYLFVNLTDVGWPVGFLLIGLASLRPADAPGAARAVRTGATRVRLLCPYVAIVPALVVVADRITDQEPISAFLGALAGVAVVLVLGRQMLVLLENGRLTDGMRSTVQVLRQREDELVHQAFHDPLTGLANRALLRDRLEHALSGRGADPVSLLFVDLDDFKTVNDSLGHDAGDRLLELVAERLRACVRPEDTVARLGGDEFAVLLGRTGAPAAPGAPNRLAERVLAGLESPFRIAGRDLRVQASLGLVPASRPGAAAEDVVQDADLAMYAAKAAGKGRCEQFEPSLRSQAVDRLELSPTCASTCPPASSSCTTSPSSTWARSRSSARRRSCAGSTRAGGCSTPVSSSASPRRPARSPASASGCSRRPAVRPCGGRRSTGRVRRWSA